ncbi:MAG TPA: OsmC family protein [Vicinamibacterales bacterium]|nr:OsmC family protein [Vicinamibacterales bacterium]
MAVETAQPRRERTPLNGVDTPKLFATLDVVKATPDLARFCFRATSKWVSGTYSETTIEAFTGAGGQHEHRTTFRYGADHPAVLVGEDRGPTPVEFLLHALAACLTAGIGNIAAARGVTLTEVKSTLEGDINLLGILGLSDQVRNGYERLRVNFTIAGDAPPAKLKEIVEQSRARSAVYDVLTNGVPVDISVQASPGSGL